jgi:hypothetical protein
MSTDRARPKAAASTPIAVTVPLEFTEKHYAALGKIVVAFQDLEQAITLALLQALHPEDDVVPKRPNTWLVVNELSFANRTKLLASVIASQLRSHLRSDAKDRPPGWLAELKEEERRFREGIRLAYDAEAARNQLVHSTWSARPFAGPENTVHRTKLRTNGKKVVIANEFVSPEDIAKGVDIAKRSAELIQTSALNLHFLLKEVEGL